MSEEGKEELTKNQDEPDTKEDGKNEAEQTKGEDVSWYLLFTSLFTQARALLCSS
jgi:hypothetical protein